MRKHEHNFGELMLFLSPILIALFFYSYREGAVCREFRIKPMLTQVYSGVGYISDMDVYRTFDVWQTPEETIARRTGDCEDLAILLASMIIEKTGLPAQIVTGDGKSEAHAWVYFKNKYYDPTRGKIVSIEKYEKEFIDINYFSFKTALRRCAEDGLFKN